MELFQTPKLHGKVLIEKNENRKKCPIYIGVERGEEKGHENGFCQQYLLLSILSSCLCCCTYSVERKRREKGWKYVENEILECWEGAASLNTSAARDSWFYCFLCVMNAYVSSHKTAFLSRQFEFDSCQIIVLIHYWLILKCLEETSVNAEQVMCILEVRIHFYWKPCFTFSFSYCLE